MGRRVSTGVAGSGAGLGSIYASGQNTLTTAVTNQNIIIDPNGTGTTLFEGGVQVRTAGELRAFNTANTFYSAVRAINSLSANTLFQLPSGNGTNGQFLSTDGSGITSWQSVPAQGLNSTDAGADATAHYLFFGTASGSIPTGQQTGFKVRSSLSFIPSEGRLIATVGTLATVAGSNAASGFLTINGTTNATKSTSSVRFTDNVAATNTTSGTITVTGGVGVSGAIWAGSIQGTPIGSTTASSGVFTTLQETSSITLKENINPISDALGIVNALQAYTYDRKDGSTKNEAGLLAEQVYEILPNLVDLDENGNPKTIQYTKLTAYLIEAVKSLTDEINLLKSK